MKKRRLGIAVALYVFLALVAVVWVMTRSSQQSQTVTQLAPHLQEWFQSFQRSLLAHIEQISDDKIVASAAQVNGQWQELPLEVRKSVADYEPVQVNPAQVKEWLCLFVQRDLEPFLATTLTIVPSETRHIAEERMLHCPAPTFEILDTLSVKGFASLEKVTIGICPATTCSSYEKLRGTLAHEWVHYALQGLYKLETVDFAREGMTEYITQKSGELLGWDMPNRSYGTEVQAISLLIPFMGNELTVWYFSENPDDALIYNRMKDVLIEQGVDQELAAKVSLLWQEKMLGHAHESLNHVRSHIDMVQLMLRKASLITAGSNLEDSARKVQEATFHFSDFVTLCRASDYKLPIATGDEKHAAAEKLFTSIAQAIAGREGLDPDRYPEYYLQEIVPVMKKVVLDGPGPSQLTPLQAEIMPLAEKVSDKASLVKFAGPISKRFKSSAQELKEEEKRLQSEYEKYDHDAQELVQRLRTAENGQPDWDEQHAAITKSVARAMQKKGIDILAQQAEAGVPMVIRQNLHRLLVE